MFILHSRKIIRLTLHFDYDSAKIISFLSVGTLVLEWFRVTTTISRKYFRVRISPCSSRVLIILKTSITHHVFITFYHHHRFDIILLHSLHFYCFQRCYIWISKEVSSFTFVFHYFQIHFIFFKESVILYLSFVISQPHASNHFCFLLHNLSVWMGLGPVQIANMQSEGVSR